MLCLNKKHSLAHGAQKKKKEQYAEAANAISEKYEIRQIFVFPASHRNDIWVNMKAAAANN